MSVTDGSITGDGAELTVRIDGVTAIDGSIPVTTTPASTAPASADILAGSVLDDSAIITIPANRIWYGSIGVQGALTGASQTSTITVNTTGTGVIPAPAVDLLALNLATGTATDAVTADTRTLNIWVYAGSTAATLDVSIDGSGVVSSSAYGYLL